MAFDKRWLAALALNALGCFLLYEFANLNLWSLPDSGREPPSSAAKNAGRRLSQTKVEIIDGLFHQDGKKIGRHPGKIFGVGGNDFAELADELGFEAFRTWGLDQLPWAMLEASRAGFKVMAGLDMTRDPRYYRGSEHCAKDLGKSDYWKKAIKTILKTVERYKDDKDLLMWLVGNELEIPIDTKKGSDCLWKRVNWVAGKVKKADPNHPVGLAIAGIASPKVKKMVKLCPNIEVLGTNIYGNEIREVGERLRKDGWTKPWAFTECGPLGPWEVPQTSWGAPMEQTSTEKGRFIMRGLRMCEDDAMCVGFMAFLWGWKWEKTGTWFGLIDDWSATKANSILNDIGQPIYDEFGPAKQKEFRIHIEGFKVDGKEAGHLGFSAMRGGEVQLEVLPVATPFDGDNGAWVHWAVTRETLVHAKSDANFPETPQSVIPDVVEGCPDSFRAKLKTKELKDEHAYRLYVFVRRKHEGGFKNFPDTVEASYAIPFFIGKQKCKDVTSGACFKEVKRVMTSTKRMGYATWPASGTFPHSTFKEFQASLHWAQHGGCPAACSLEIAEDAKTDCSVPTHLRYEKDLAAIQKLLEPHKYTHPEEKCHKAVPHEECWYATKWLMEEGRFKTKDFPEITADSTWAEGQLALWRRARNNCKKPCMGHEKDSRARKAPDVKKPKMGAEEEECHTAVPDEDCFWATKWLMDEGRIKHPDAYPEVTAESTWEDAQRALWKSGKNECKKPCKEEPEEISGKAGTAKKAEGKEEECHTSVPHEDCYHATKWLMDEGRIKHPDAYPDVTAESSWEDAQHALWKRGKSGCKKPCNHESETETEEVDQEECHNAVPHEDCYYGTKWLMEEGIQKNPEWFPEITPDSPWADAQKALWKRGKNGCMKPCPVTK